MLLKNTAIVLAIPTFFRLTPMDSGRPKRNRQRRNAGRDDGGQSYSSSAAMPASEEGARTPQTPGNADAQHDKRIIRNKHIAQQIAKYDKHMESDEFIEKVHGKLMDLRYVNCTMREEGHELRSKNIYNRIKNGTADPAEHMEWEHSITRDAAEKLCAMVNHLLSSGPLSESEIGILDRCISLLKAYYVGRAQLAIDNLPEKTYCSKYTYYPKPNTYAYRIFIGKYELPMKTLLIKED